ncbi:hypothetical protein J4E82_008090 [Alternaria postmessia]|uniref:uncharacterized protein n=1 Tax=Alternaria postmessia TaxID=1187938 RepID=UPI0022243B13|nr:uncharacterized protein J4E82_008090 [Alternaria postmessia]KAI5373220.1 hypothetical protein J4E82_008090 [Alternaria postmessia]
MMTVKREEHGEHNVRVKQEERPEEPTPTLALKVEHANHATIVPQETNRKNRNKKALKSARSDPAGGFSTKKQRQLLRKAREKEQFEAALNEKFEEVKADNGMQVGKLENKLEQEKAKTEEAHRLLRESVKLVAHMTSLLKGQGGSVH